jgi:hypothetical protein
VLVNAGLIPLTVSVVAEEKTAVPMTILEFDTAAGAAQLAEDPQLVTVTGLASFAFVIEPANIAFVTLPVSPEPTSVPAAGKVHVLLDGIANVGLKAPVVVRFPERTSEPFPTVSPANVGDELVRTGCVPVHESPVSARRVQEPSVVLNAAAVCPVVAPP